MQQNAYFFTLIYIRWKILFPSDIQAKERGQFMYDYGSHSEEQLIRKAKRGDVKAFSELYARIYKELYRFALYTMKHPQDAEDAVSETVIAAYENIGKLKKETSFRGWIFKILVNCCKKHLQQVCRTEQLNEEMAVQEVSQEENYDVREAFMRLEEVDRMIVSCSVFEGYSSDEIGEILELKPATVRSRKSRALEKMRGML